MGGGGQRHAPATLQGLGGPQGRYGPVQKFSHPPRFDPRTVQIVGNRYTDRALASHDFCKRRRRG